MTFFYPRADFELSSRSRTVLDDPSLDLR